MEEIFFFHIKGNNNNFYLHVIHSAISSSMVNISIVKYLKKSKIFSTPIVLLIFFNVYLQ